MSPALTATTWDSTLRYFVEHGDLSMTIIAGILLDIVNNTDDPAVARILDHGGLYLMEQS